MFKNTPIHDSCCGLFAKRLSMKHGIKLIVLAFFTIPFFAGCGGSSNTPVADADDIANYAASHPDSGAGTEPEGGED